MLSKCELFLARNTVLRGRVTQKEMDFRAKVDEIIATTQLEEEEYAISPLFQIKEFLTFGLICGVFPATMGERRIK